MATLTYVYADSTVVLGPLATQAEPHSYDLCETHASGLTAPRGWEVVRLATEFVPAGPSPDDLDALAAAVREASRGPRPAPAARAAGAGAARGPAAPVTHRIPEPVDRAARRAHLRVVRSEDGDAE